MSLLASVDGAMREIVSWPVMANGAVRELDGGYAEVEGAVRMIYQKMYRWEKWTSLQSNGSYKLVKVKSNQLLINVEREREIFLYSQYSVNGQGRLDLMDGNKITLSEGNISGIYKYSKPKTGTLNECMTVKTGSGKYDWEIYGNQYDVEWVWRYSKGDTLIEIVESADDNAYPQNGYQDGFWYIKL